ncbi:MAG: DUF3017 domain-containing protein [Marmoricola sp.]
MTSQLPPPPPEPPRERRPSTLGGLVYLLLLAASVAGLVMVAFGPWREGIALIGAMLLVAAAFRATVREGNAGMLRVRSRWFDVVALTGLGVLLVVLAKLVPSQPPL